MSYGFLEHEQRWRGDGALSRVRVWPVTVCGAGAIGANLIESLARQGFGALSVIDCDRIEERNLSTQPWQRGDIGAHKAKLLSATLFRALRVAVTARTERLTPQNAAGLLAGASVVVDAFDNIESRCAVAEACRASATPCLHVGLSGDGYGEALWDGHWRAPSTAGPDPCDYPMARNLVLLTVSVAAETLIRFARAGVRENRSVTLQDLTIREMELA